MTSLSQGPGFAGTFNAAQFAALVAATYTGQWCYVDDGTRLTPYRSTGVEWVSMDLTAAQIAAGATGVAGVSADGRVLTPAGAVGAGAALFARGASASHTGNTTLTQLIPSVLVPAGVMTDNAVMKIDAVFTFTANTNNKTYDILIGPTLGTAQSIFTRTRAGATAQLDALCLLLANKGSTAAQELVTAPTGLYSINSTSAPTSNTIDFSVEQYIWVTGTLANAADTVALRAMVVVVYG